MTWLIEWWQRRRDRISGTTYVQQIARWRDTPSDVKPLPLPAIKAPKAQRASDDAPEAA